MLLAVMVNHTQAIMREQVHGEGLSSCLASMTMGS